MAREMKESGVEWAGVIPSEWDSMSFWQAIERMGTGLNPRDNFELTKDDTYYYVLRPGSLSNFQLRKEIKLTEIEQYIKIYSYIKRYYNSSYLLPKKIIKTFE